MRNSHTGHARPRVSLGAVMALMIAAPLMGVTLGATAAHAQFNVDVRIGYAPPPLPDYEQPPLPGPDYIWVPGYWDLPPEQGLMWTPAWWGWDYGAYRFHPGYWGYEVGWYGGIDYGYGYHGHGWDGGHWDHGHVAYNRAVINVNNVRVNNIYYAPVPARQGPRVSYNGGAGGVTAQPRPEDMRGMNGPHIAPTQNQQQHMQQAARNPRAAASQITPAWNPPAVHRIGNDGAPIQRGAVPGRGGAGAPPQYQQQYQQRGQNPTTPNYGQNNGQNQRPQNERQMPQGQAAPYTAPTPRPIQQQPVPTYSHTAPQNYAPQQQGQNTPNYGRPAPQQYTPPRAPQQPAPNYNRAAPPQPQVHQAPPQPQFHAAPPPPAPHPAPAPKPQPPHNEHDHP